MSSPSELRRAYLDPDIAARYEGERSRHAFQRVRAALERRTLRRAFAALPRDATILDVACGTGRLAPLLLSFGRSLTGVDVSPAMLSTARSHALERTAWVTGDAQRLPFASRSFDVVVSTRFVRHLDAPGRATVFRELFRVARRFVVVETLLGTGLVWRWKRLAKGRTWAESMATRRPTAAGITSELRACGLRVTSWHALIALVSQPHVFVCETGPS